ncbi:putative acetyltransferase [Prunus yedoensis var. nudiflora]|uniref:Putative acetyltransferase n=1 Tax=Prunus yedoensis var. nudiflora TaxID=2094558 RepID=A0A314Z627_PRUYE|nr:putative acetyltransferase [Prunus yedoensis var. nudiflora]
MWRSITRARGLPRDQGTSCRHVSFNTLHSEEFPNSFLFLDIFINIDISYLGCRLAANNRGRLEPPLSGDYFGNSIHPIRSEIVPAGELLEHGLGWAAWKLHEAVVNHNDKFIREPC